MIDPRCHVGETHGIYTLVDVLYEKDKYGHWIYKGVCNVCGYERFATHGQFAGPSQIAKICTHVGANGQYVTPTKWTNQRIGSIFGGMKIRCYNRNDKSYKWYGQKGIKICDEWVNNPKLFEDWAMANGYSDELTIDRIDENKDYSPDNCRWITLQDNAKYKSTTSLIEVDGEVHSGKDWAKILGLGQNRINTDVREYGLENTIEFIKRYQNNPTLKPNNKQSYYDVYMNNSTISI